MSPVGQNGIARSGFGSGRHYTKHRKQIKPPPEPPRAAKATARPRPQPKMALGLGLGAWGLGLGACGLRLAAWGLRLGAWGLGPPPSPLSPSSPSSPSSPLSARILREKRKILEIVVQCGQGRNQRWHWAWGLGLAACGLRLGAWGLGPPPSPLSPSSPSSPLSAGILREKRKILEIVVQRSRRRRKSVRSWEGRRHGLFPDLFITSSFLPAIPLSPISPASRPRVRSASRTARIPRIAFAAWAGRNRPAPGYSGPWSARMRFAL